jgi:hypothetical protein
MAEKEEKLGDVCHVDICVVENGYKIKVRHEDPNQPLGVRAGWYPAQYIEPKCYVEKTKDAVLKRLKEVL